MDETASSHCPNCLAEYREGFVYGDALPDARMIRVWVLESQAEKAQKIARRALSGDDAI